MFSPSIQKALMNPNPETVPFYISVKHPVLILSYFYHRYQQLAHKGHCHLISSTLSPKYDIRHLLNKYYKEVLRRMAGRYEERKEGRKKDTREIKSLRVISFIANSAVTIPLFFLQFFPIPSSGRSSCPPASPHGLRLPHLCSFLYLGLCIFQTSIVLCCHILLRSSQIWFPQKQTSSVSRPLGIKKYPFFIEDLGLLWCLHHDNTSHNER